MSDWRDWDALRSGPKKPPPADGIKIQKVGTTWWGKRWIEALEEVLGGQAGRLARGRTYARAGRTHDLVVADGVVTAKVTGSRAEPYEVRIALSQLTPQAWQAAIVGLTAQAAFAARLLAGEMPEAIDDVFRAADASLFPRARAELTTRCSCPDWGDPCKHVAATHYVLGEALDRDPFLLFELRGRTKTEVLDALRVARARPEPSTKSKRRSTRSTAPVDETPKVTLQGLSAATYDAPRESLPTLHFSFDPPSTHGALLRQLGSPGAWRGEQDPAEALAPLVRRAAEVARRIALAEEAPADAPRAEVPPQPSTPRKSKSRAKKR